MGGTILFEDAESPFGNQLNKRPLEYTRSHHSGVRTLTVAIVSCKYVHQHNLYKYKGGGLKQEGFLAHTCPTNHPSLFSTGVLDPPLLGVLDPRHQHHTTQSSTPPLVHCTTDTFAEPALDLSPNHPTPLYVSLMHHHHRHYHHHCHPNHHHHRQHHHQNVDFVDFATNPIKNHN